MITTWGIKKQIAIWLGSDMSAVRLLLVPYLPMAMEHEPWGAVELVGSFRHCRLVGNNLTLSQLDDGQPALIPVLEP